MYNTFNIGVYGESYNQTVQFFTIKLPAAALRHFPQAVRERFEDLRGDQIELSLCIQTDVQSANSVRNLITHPLVYPECPPGVDRAQAFFSMGIFAMNGVRSYDDRRRYLFPDGFYPMDVHLHENGRGTAISPNNCIFEVDQPVSTFVTAVDLRQPLMPVMQPCRIPYREKAAACFHVLLREGREIYLKLQSSKTPQEFVEKLDEPLKGQIRSLLCLTT